MAKKIKKVETPIDQRETFVSLMKSFADSDISVAEKLETLYDLQQADNEIDKLMQNRGELPTEVANLEEELAELQEKADSINDMIEEFTKTIANKKQSIIDCDNQIAAYKKQLESVANSREYDSINKEVENQELERLIAEKCINESKVAIANAKADLEDIKDRASIREEDLAAKKAELESIVESTAKLEESLVAKREACAAKIDERTMSAYNRIRASVSNHLAVVTIYNGDSCGGCFNTITPQRQIDVASNKKLIICEHCGRIIVNPDFDQK
ncbi:MAG: C4-type zinc ribbon domain-containing protein [Bacteroidales bacterium]|nr:C4-type zinc ribbon domain-containing protein [Bacteroidales bacterium]